jgi:hypothetical protein
MNDAAILKMWLDFAIQIGYVVLAGFLGWLFFRSLLD